MFEAEIKVGSRKSGSTSINLDYAGKEKPSTLEVKHQYSILSLHQRRCQLLLYTSDSADTFLSFLDRTPLHYKLVPGLRG